MNFALVGNHIAVKLDTSPDKTDGGIYIPEQAKTKSTQGEVVQVGPGTFSEQLDRHIPISVKVGQHVIVQKYGLYEVEIEGVDLVVVKEDDVLAIVPPKAAEKKK